MSEFHKVTDRFSVAPQIALADLARAAESGFTMVINNRPDGEVPDQPNSAEVEAAARAAGLDYAHIPVRGAPTPEQVAEERGVLARAKGPVLAFCRSGTRSIVTWSLGEVGAGGRSREELVKLGQAAGYDLANVLVSG
ncbi:MAG TPA: TIGR01244 family sulfur transferase [Caulobacteraceae bacterium]|nr:TIGR01244 family sulfur transferase [Caulobacteraceae bacterium]